MEKMAYMYNSQAEENNSIIVSALGMESVPADLGIEFLYNNFIGMFAVYRYIRKRNIVARIICFIFRGIGEC